MSGFRNPPVACLTSAFERRRSGLLNATHVTLGTTRDQLIVADVTDVTDVATSERLRQVVDFTNYLNTCTRMTISKTKRLI